MAVVAIKPTTQIEKKTRTVVDTILVTPEKVRGWKSPLFQRQLRENRKVLALAEQLKQDGGVWPGIVTLGVLAGETYLIDGQHRAHVGRGLSERDRSPAYSRMKAIFARRIMQETGRKVSLPQPGWAHDNRAHLPSV